MVKGLQVVKGRVMSLPRSLVPTKRNSSRPCSSTTSTTSSGSEASPGWGVKGGLDQSPAESLADLCLGSQRLPSKHASCVGLRCWGCHTLSHTSTYRGSQLRSKKSVDKGANSDLRCNMPARA